MYIYRVTVFTLAGTVALTRDFATRLSADYYAAHASQAGRIAAVRLTYLPSPRRALAA